MPTKSQEHISMDEYDSTVEQQQLDINDMAIINEITFTSIKENLKNK
jgi:hypothetical protein